MISSLRQLRALVRKDVVVELRGKEVLASSIFFAMIVLVVFNFAFEPGARDLGTVGAGILWTAFLFAGLLGMNRLFLVEREGGALDGLMSCPVERTTLYVAKCASLGIFLALTELATLALFIVFFNVPIRGRLVELLVVTGMGTLGLAALGTTFAAVAVRTRTREVMLPLLLVPLAVPLLIAAVKCTGAVLGDGGLLEARRWLELLGVFDAVFLAVGYLTFPTVLEE